MRMYDLIYKKRQGEELDHREISFIVNGYTRGQIPDYQVAALLMAIFFQGLTAAETTALTTAMAESGDRVDLSSLPGFKVDKHSTGGVGDKTTLVLAPLVAAAGLPVAKMSGRGLGHTGGTIDKLESIPGLKTSISPDAFLQQVKKIGLAVAAQTGNLAPADKKLYALRDVTATVDSISLIASSIMSKKLAAGADAVVLDVKVGKGAFMRSVGDARKLARTMVNIGSRGGLKTVALITAMDCPLGNAVGNALEVREAIETLQGNGPADLVELCLALGTKMLLLGGRAESGDEARRVLTGLLEAGKALEKFKELVREQGGNVEVLDKPDLLPQARYSHEVKAPETGYVAAIDAAAVGRAAMLLGAGRQTKEDEIDPAAGVVLIKKPGERVRPGDTVAKLYYNDEEKLPPAAEILFQSFSYTTKKPELSPVVLDEIE